MLTFNYSANVRQTEDNDMQDKRDGAKEISDTVTSSEKKISENKLSDDSNSGKENAIVEAQDTSDGVNEKDRDSTDSNTDNTDNNGDSPVKNGGEDAASEGEQDNVEKDKEGEEMQVDQTVDDRKLGRTRV